MAYLFKESKKNLKVHTSSFYLEKEYLELLDFLASYENTSRSALVEKMIRLYYKKGDYYANYKRAKKAKKKVFSKAKCEKQTKFTK